MNIRIEGNQADEIVLNIKFEGCSCDILCFYTINIKLAQSLPFCRFIVAFRGLLLLPEAFKHYLPTLDLPAMHD